MSIKQPSKGPLSGLLVVALEQAIAAPYCTRLLADQGARVIKVERPDGGDFARAYDSRAKGQSSHFVWCNRSKESLTLDLKKTGAVPVLKQLISGADIFVANLAPGALARLGLGSDALLEENPGLIACEISGFGSGGPYDGKKAYDLLIQAEAGFLSITGTEENAAKSGISIADIAAGTQAYQAILAALLQKARTGKGDRIEVSMLEALSEWMGYPLYFASDGAAPPPRTGAAHASIFPYGPFKTADGEILFGLQNDREWRAFCETVLKAPKMANDPRFVGNAGRNRHRDEIQAQIDRRFAKLTTAEATAGLEAANIGTGVLRTMADVWAHPQLAARQRWQPIGTQGGAIPALKPLTGEGWDGVMGDVPALGADSRKILDELGISRTVQQEICGENV